MQWTGLRAQMPGQASPVAGSAGRFAVPIALSVNQLTAGRSRTKIFSDFRVTGGAGLCCWWFQNARRRIPCTPVCAVSPRSRKEWLLLHNLPDTVGKELEEKEEIQDGALADSRDPEFEIAEKRSERRELPRTESFLESKKSKFDSRNETGETLELSDTRHARQAWRSGGPERGSQLLGSQIFHGTDGDLESGKIRESGQEKRENIIGDTTERNRGHEFFEESRTVRDIWTNRRHAERTYDSHGAQTLHGTDGIFDSENSRESEKKKGIDSGVKYLRAQTTEQLKESDSGRGLWKIDGVVERYQEPHDPASLFGARGDLQTQSFQESSNRRETNPGAAIGGADSFGSTEVTRTVRENDEDVVDGSTRRGPAFFFNNGRDSDGGIFGDEKAKKNQSNQAEESNAEAANGRAQSLKSTETGVEGFQTFDAASQYQQEGIYETRNVEFSEAEKNPEVESYATRDKKMVDYSGEKVIEVWKKGRVVKRYKPLGIEFLYGRTKPSRLYGPLNSRGEVPGSDFAPVPRRYRDRCEHQQGWNINEVVTKILELNHWEDIDLVLNQWVGRYNRKNFHPLMMAMTRTGALKHSARLFTWMKTQRCYRARSDIYNLVIWLYARHNRVDRSRALFKEMQEWRCKPDLETYNALINVHGRARQWRESLRFYDRMLQAAVPPSTGTYNNLISACGTSGQWEKALELYQNMKTGGVFVDVVTHNTVLTALKIGGQYALAIKHFEQSLQWDVVPDRVTLNIIISCFSKMERYDEAVQLFNSMMNQKWDGCYPDLVTFTTVMHVYAACGQLVNVKAVFDMMVGEGIVPNIVSYNTLIGAYAVMGMDVEALKVFDSLQTVGFEPDIVSYTALMNAYSKSGKPDDAAGVFKLMKKRSRKPNIVTYNTLIDAYSSAGRLTEALRVLPDMDFDEILPNVVTICSLIVGCGQSGDIEKVNSVLKVASLRNIRLNVNVYNTVLSVYLNGGMFEDAVKLYAAMKDDGVNPDGITFAVLINGAAKFGNISQAQMHFDDMLALGVGMSVEACSALIHAYAEQGLPEPAHAVLTRMKDAGCAPNVFTYTSLIHAYTTADMAEAAIAVFEEMETGGVELDAAACSALFTAFNQCGQAQKTMLQWSKWREHIQFGTAAYTELSKACNVLADWKMAMELLDHMQQGGVIPNPTIGNHLLRSLSKSGKVEQLMKVFLQLQELGIMISKDTYKILIEGYSRTRNWRECLEILDRFRADDLQPDPKTYKMVLNCLAKDQLWDNYIEVHDQMMSTCCFLDLEVSKVMLHALRESGQEERAQELESIIQASRQENERILREEVSVLSLKR